MDESQVRSITHLILVVGSDGEESSRMYWGQVSEKMAGETPSPDKFRMSLYSKSRPDIRMRTELRWAPRVPANMPMPLSPEDAPEWELSGRALQGPRSIGPGVWSLDVKKFGP